MHKLSLSFPVLQIAAVAAAALTGCLLSSPAGAERTLYRWTTDEGSYAFTDDRRQVPARYVDRMEVTTLKRLRDYERFTPVETPRIVRKTEPAPEAPAAAVALSPYPVGEAPLAPTISVRTGDENAPIIDVSPGTSRDPILIQKRHFMPDGEIATRSNTIVSQGDRILTVIQPQSHEHDVTDFGDEDALLED